MVGGRGDGSCCVPAVEAVVFAMMVVSPAKRDRTPPERITLALTVKKSVIYCQDNDG